LFPVRSTTVFDFYNTSTRSVHARQDDYEVDETKSTVNADEAGERMAKDEKLARDAECSG